MSDEYTSAIYLGGPPGVVLQLPEWLPISEAVGLRIATVVAIGCYVLIACVAYAIYQELTSDAPAWRDLKHD